MATPLDNIVTPWLCVRSPEHRAEIPSLEARRMLTKLGELHQPLRLRLEKNPSAAWGSTCLGRPCGQRPNMVLEVDMMYRRRSKAELVPFGIL
jgi:hypothetical protein